MGGWLRCVDNDRQSNSSDMQRGEEGGRSHRPRRVERIASSGSMRSNRMGDGSYRRRASRPSRTSTQHPACATSHPRFSRSARTGMQAQQRSEAGPQRCPSPSIALFLSHAALLAMQCAHLSPRSPAPLRPRTRAHMVASLSSRLRRRVESRGKKKKKKRQSKSAEGKKRRGKKGQPNGSTGRRSRVSPRRHRHTHATCSMAVHTRASGARRQVDGCSASTSLGVRCGPCAG